MSRSYKKSPVVKEKASKFGKRQAGKAVRRFNGCIPNGKWYRRLYCSWDISDYSFRCTFRAWMKDYESSNKVALSEISNVNWRHMNCTKKEIINEWRKYYFSK